MSLSRSGVLFLSADSPLLSLLSPPFLHSLSLWVGAQSSKSASAEAPTFQATKPMKCRLVSSEAQPVCCPRGRGRTFTLDRVLARALVGGLNFPPTATRDHTQCVVRDLTHTLAVLPAHVCRQKRLGCLHVQAHRFLCLKAFTSKNHGTEN